MLPVAASCNLSQLAEHGHGFGRFLLQYSSQTLHFFVLGGEQSAQLNDLEVT